MKSWLTDSNHVGGLLIMCFSLAYGVLSSEIPQVATGSSFDAATMPRFLAVCGLILSILLVAKPSNATPHGIKRELNWGLFAVFVLLMSAYGLLIRPAGFILATIMFLCLGTRLLGGSRWASNLAIATSVACLFWFLMTQALGVYVSAWPAFLGA